MAYKIETAVWRTGSGWQPHDIQTRWATTLAEARGVAQQIVASGAVCGSPVVTIYDGEEIIEEIED